MQEEVQVVTAVMGVMELLVAHQVIQVVVMLRLGQEEEAVELRVGEFSVQTLIDTSRKKTFRAGRIRK